MTENSQITKEEGSLTEFLIEDLKETGEYLRDTDRKLSFLIQIYTGAIVLIATLSVNDVINKTDFLGVPGLIILLTFIFFTQWLFIYSLKSKETKSIYIHRMNFLRREMHYFLQNKNKDLPGYWTSSELTSITKQLLSNEATDKDKKPKRVGLDDLYPNALRGVLVLLSIAFAFVFSKLMYEIDKLNLKANIAFPFFMTFVFFVITIIIWLYTRKLVKDNENSIKYQIEIYKVSSEQKDQKEQSDLVATGITKEVTQNQGKSKSRRKARNLSPTP